MPPSKTPTPPLESLDSHDALLRREEQGARRRRRRRAAAVLVILVLTAAAAVGARPALHVAKAWQARRHARQAVRLTEAGKLEDARTHVQDALTIWRQEPEALHAAALFLSRAGVHKQAHEYWLELDRQERLSPADLRTYALTELALGDAAASQVLLRRVWPDGTPGVRADWLLALQIALRQDQPGEAATLAESLLQDPETPPRERLQAAAVLVASSSASTGQNAVAWKNVLDLARAGTTPESLSALILLAQARTAARTAPLPADAPTLAEILVGIDAHPLAHARESLLATDLRVAQEPARRAELMGAATDRYAQTKDDADLAALAAWLYAKGEFDQVLAVLPPARVGNDRALHLQQLDALAALGRWTDIRASIQSRKFPLDPMLAEMFLARCADQLGEPEVRDARWRGALDAAGKDPAKLVALGQYAAKNGVTTTAGAAFEGAVRAAPDSRQAHEELVRFLDSAGDTRRLRAAVTELLARWPQDLAARNDSAYLDALLGDNLPAARNTARELVRAQPANLAFRTTLALGELRLHNGLAAVDALDRRAVGEATTLQPRQAAVYAAVLWEASYLREATEALKNVPLTRLLPEERELIRPIHGESAP